MTRFLCVGDLHLGAGADYGREPGDRLRDQEAVWTRALELAGEHDVDAVLFAGDAFHHRRPTPAELIAFQRPLQAFTAEHDIEVVAINGNHDCEAAHLPTALEVFGREVDLYTHPGIWHADGGTSVACLPWAPVSRLIATRGGGDRDELNREAAGLLISAARGLRAQIPTGQPAVLMLHWSISGASTPTGVATDDFREVVLDAFELAELGFDAIVAGHIHKPQILNGGAFGPVHGLLTPSAPVATEATAPLFYVGSPTPVDFGEGASDHGCWLLDIDADEVRPHFLPIESRPFVTVGLSIDDLHGSSLDSDEDVTDAVVRVRYQATEEQARRIDHAAIKRALYDAGVHKVYAVQVDVIREQRARVEGVDEDLAPIKALELWLTANEISDDVGGELVDLTDKYLEEAAA